MSMTKKLRIIPIGGSGEVGKNSTVVEYDNQILIVDSGIMFPENDMLGIDYIIPDFNYIVENKEKVVAVVITHGHEDHTGSIRHLMEVVDAPIYGTPLTLGLLEVKLAKADMLEQVQLNVINAGESFTVGDFTVEFCHVCHSIPDGVALGITTPAGLIVHSGDYKFDHTPVDNWPTDYAKLAEWSKRGVLALLADSTNAERPGWTPSEKVIDGALDTVFKNAEGRIIVATFASLISRMEQVGKAAQRYGRKMAFAGYAMKENSKMAMQLGYLKIPKKTIVSLEKALEMPPSKVVIMGTGSQGEPSSIMGRLASGRNNMFDVVPGDTIVLSSHPIPGNEETVSRTINRLIQKGANMIYDPILPVHVSGHASQEEIKFLIHLVKPKHLIPIHGEARQLRQHANMAAELGIPRDHIAEVENGTIIEFENGKMEIKERLPGGYIFVDGASVGETDFRIIRQRESLSRAGVVIVSALINKASGRTIRKPEITTHGFQYQDEMPELMDKIINETEEILRMQPDDPIKTVERAVKGLISKEIRIKPIVFAVIQEI